MVTIHSDHVEIVQDLASTEWDLESALIEVDGPSLTILIINYRHFNYRGDPTLAFSETVIQTDPISRIRWQSRIELLNVMVEDARRGCTSRMHVVSAFVIEHSSECPPDATSSPTDAASCLPTTHVMALTMA